MQLHLEMNLNQHTVLDFVYKPSYKTSGISHTGNNKRKKHIPNCSKDTPHNSDAYLTNTHTPANRDPRRSAVFRASLYLHGRDARAPCLQGSILRSILQHCKLMIQQIPSVLLFPLLLLFPQSVVALCLSHSLISCCAAEMRNNWRLGSAGPALLLWYTPLINNAAC